MSYQRKTVDVWFIQGFYDNEWYDECAENSLSDARQQLKCYRENSPYPSRMKKKRIKIEDYNNGNY